MTDQEIIELNELANVATTKAELGPFWEMFERMAGGEFVTPPGPGGTDRRRVLEDWKILVFAQRQCGAQTLGPRLAGAYSTLEYLSLIAGSGESLQPFAVEQLGEQIANQLRNMATAPQSPILSRVVAALVLLDRDLADEQSANDNSTVDSSFSSTVRCDATTHRFAQRHLSELLVTYPVLLCNRIVLSPKNFLSGALIPIAHGIARNRKAQFPRESHGGGILTRDAIRSFASRPLTQLAMTQNAPSARQKTPFELRIQGLPVASVVFESAYGGGSGRSGLVASTIESGSAGGHKFPMSLVTGTNTGVAAGKLFPVIAAATNRAIMESAGLVNKNGHEPVRYGNLNPAAQADTVGLLGILNAHEKRDLIDDRFQDQLFGHSMECAEHFISQGGTGGSLDDRLSAFVNAIADAGITKSDIKNSAPDSTAQSVARALLAFSLGPSLVSYEALMAAKVPGSRLSDKVSIRRYANATPAFAQEFIAAISQFGITTQDFRDQLAWCSNSSADGWRHAIEIVETRDAMRAAIASALETAAATAIPGSPTAAIAEMPEARRSRTALRL